MCSVQDDMSDNFHHDKINSPVVLLSSVYNNNNSANNLTQASFSLSLFFDGGEMHDFLHTE